MSKQRSRQVATVVLVFGAVVFGMVLAGGLDWTPAGFGSVERFAAAPAQSVAPSPGGHIPSFANLADAVSPAVVSIRSVSFESEGDVQGGGGDPFEFFFGPRQRDPRQDPREFRQEAGGSGFLVSADGLIATNNHVVEGATELMVTIEDREYPAQLRGADPATDLALIQVEVDRPLPYLKLGESEAMRVGDWVMVIGNPLRLGRTVTVGVVSATGRALGITDISFENFIQTDAAINFGNSGGPMVNLDGEVVGIATAINWGAENIGFAVPVETLKTVLPQLEAEGTVRRGYLGVNIENLDYRAKEAFGLDSTDGALVIGVVEGTPAFEAGLEHADIILRVDDQPVHETRDLIDYVARQAPGEKVKLDLLRDGKEVEKVVTLGERPPLGNAVPARQEESEGGIEWLGLRYQDLTPGLKESHGIPRDVEGIWVGEVSPRSPLVDERLQPGDVIAEVNGRPVGSVEEFEAIVESAESGSFLRLYVQRFDPRSGASNQFFAFVRVP